MEVKTSPLAARFRHIRSRVRGDVQQRASNSIDRVRDGKESDMRSLEKRLADLERRAHCDPILLEMPDGSTGKIVVGPGDGLIDLFARSMREMAAGVGFSRDVDTLRRSIGRGDKTVSRFAVVGFVGVRRRYFFLVFLAILLIHKILFGPSDAHSPPGKLRFYGHLRTSGPEVGQRLIAYCHRGLHSAPVLS